MLTDQQVLHFKTFGFVAMPGLFSPDEMSEIEREFEEVVAEERQGQPFRGEKRQAVMAFAELRPKLMSLIDDDRIYGPMEQLLGPDFIWWGSDGNLYVGDTAWHPDAHEPELGHGRIKIAFYLDPVDRDSGCIRFIPGSHRLPFHDQLRAAQDVENAADHSRGQADGGSAEAVPGAGARPEQARLRCRAARPARLCRRVAARRRRLLRSAPLPLLVGRTHGSADVHAELLLEPHDGGAGGRDPRHAQDHDGSAAGDPVPPTRPGPRGRLPRVRPAPHESAWPTGCESSESPETRTQPFKLTGAHNSFTPSSAAASSGAYRGAHATCLACSRVGPTDSDPSQPHKAASPPRRLQPPFRVLPLCAS